MCVKRKLYNVPKAKFSYPLVKALVQRGQETFNHHSLGNEIGKDTFSIPHIPAVFTDGHCFILTTVYPALPIYLSCLALKSVHFLRGKKEPFKDPLVFLTKDLKYFIIIFEPLCISNTENVLLYLKHMVAITTSVVCF